MRATQPILATPPLKPSSRQSMPHSLSLDCCCWETEAGPERLSVWLI